MSRTRLLSLAFVLVVAPLVRAEDGLSKDELLKRAEERVKQGDNAGAIQDFTKVLEADPKNALVYLSRARAQYRSNDYRRALEDALKATELDPKLQDAYLYSAYSREWLGDLAGAVADTNKNLELAPESCERLADRGRLMHSLKRYPDAISDLSWALAIKNDYLYARELRGKYYMEQQNWEAARRDFNYVLNEPTEAALISSGTIWHQLRQYEPAVNQFARALALNPRNTATLLSMAESQALSGSFDQALASCQKAIDIDPKNALFIQTKGGYRYDQGDFAGAVDDFSSALELDPKAVLAQLRRSQAYRALGKLDAALADMTRVVEALSAAPEACQMRAYIHVDRQDHAAALADCSKVIEQRPGAAQVWFLRGAVRSAFDQKAAAEQDFAKAKEIGGWTDAVLNTMRGQAEALFKRPTSADEFVKRGIARALVADRDGSFNDNANALVDDPRHPEALWQQALNAIALNRQYVAVQSLTKASEIFPKAPKLYAKTGEYLLSLEDANGALPKLNKALELDPQDAHTLALRGEAFRLTRQFDNALSDCAKAGELDSSDWFIPRTRGLVLFTQGQVAQAQREFEAALRLFPAGKPALDVDIQTIVRRVRNPWNYELEANPSGDDVAAFAQAVNLKGDAGDPNAARWHEQMATANPNLPSDRWIGRWKYADNPTWVNNVTDGSGVFMVANRVYIIFQDGQSNQLIVAVRDEKNPNRIAGRAAGTRSLRGATLFTGLIVDGERIDGAWQASYGSGRWDFRRTLRPGK